MGCPICGRSNCCRSFHSIEEQEKFGLYEGMEVAELIRICVERDKEIEDLTAENSKLREGISAIAALIRSSDGVVGLHKNGDVAGWDELMKGGEFEDWLAPLDAAIDVL